MVDRRSNPWIAAISVAIVALAAPHARAQSAGAEALFVEGDKLMKAGKFAEACTAFEGSNKLEARAGTLIRLGECREKTHELASAWSAYKDSLTRVKDPRKKQIATDKVAELEPKLSHLTITVPGGVAGLAITRNDKPVDAAEWNHAMPINGGNYTLVARAPNHGEWTQTVAVAEAQANVVVEVKLPDAATTPTTPPANPPEQPPTTPTAIPATHPIDVATPTAAPQPPSDEGSPWTGKRKAAVGLVVVAVASGGAGLVFGKIAKGREDDAFAACPDPAQACAMAKHANDLLASGRHFALAANISFGVAAAAAIGGVVLWVTGAPESHGVAIVPSVATDRGGIAVVGRF